MNLTERIIFARENADLSASELARLMNITPQAVQNWEYGKSFPRLKNLKQLSDALNVSEEWLATGAGSFKKASLSSDEQNKLSDEIIRLLDLLDGERKKDAIELLQNMAKQQKILKRYGL